MRGITATASIDAHGRVAFDDDTRVRAGLLKLAGKRVKVSVEALGKRRSTDANAYYWGVVLALISESTGHSADDLHYEFRRMLLSDGDGPIRVGKSTATLDSAQFARYVDQVIAFAATELGITIPPADAAAKPIM